MRTKRLIVSAVFAALIFVSITFFHIPNGLGGVIHFGDGLIFIAATILPFPYAMAVAAIGAGLFNLLMVPMWLPFTVIIKPLMTLCFSAKSETILGESRNAVGPFVGLVINTVLYFFANWILFDNYTALAAVPPLLVQGGGSIVIFFVLAYSLDRIGLKSRLAKEGIL